MHTFILYFCCPCTCSVTYRQCSLSLFFFSSTSLLLPTHLPPPSCTHVQSCNPMDFSPPDSSVHGFFPGKNTGVGCHFLLHRHCFSKGHCCHSGGSVSYGHCPLTCRLLVPTFLPTKCQQCLPFIFNYYVSSVLLVFHCILLIQLFLSVTGGLGVICSFHTSYIYLIGPVTFL